MLPAVELGVAEVVACFAGASIIGCESALVSAFSPLSALSAIGLRCKNNKVATAKSKSVEMAITIFFAPVNFDMFRAKPDQYGRFNSGCDWI